MLSIESLKSFNVMFATPIYGGGSPVYIASLYGLSGDCVKAGMETRLELHPDADPIRGRNAILKRFLDGSFTHLFWIDADILFSSAQVFRLLLADRDVAVGVPPIKEIPVRYPFFPIDDHADDDGFCKVYSAVTGFMCIKRQVFDTLKTQYPEYQYQDGWRFFDNMIDEKSRYLTEDYAFCKLCYDAGIDIYADVHSKLGHQGNHIFQGDLASHLGF